ncbi:MAG: zeta toxin family protein [Dehalococcoidia bacterium]|nr:zeta toxin family protein [Dehalococcoidia bacterium]
MTQSAPAKKIRIIAGPNGAGKTTFATEFLPNEAGSLTFVNADMIASGLNPFQPERAAVQAGRLMLRLIESYVKTAETFAIETTMSGRLYARMIPKWQAQGYSVQLYFFSLPSPEMAVARVQNRVREGGHNIPEDVVHRRFHAGWGNFQQIYRELVDEWAHYDASGNFPVIVEEGGR